MSHLQDEGNRKSEFKEKNKMDVIEKLRTPKDYLLRVSFHSQLDNRNFFWFYRWDLKRPGFGFRKICDHPKT